MPVPDTATATAAPGMPERYAAAATFEAYLETVEANEKLWRDAGRLARIADADVARAAALPRTWHLLVLSEDWCGDAVNSVPFLARLADAAPTLDLRVLGRDANPDLMDAHLTGASRSIPVAIVYDAHFQERGWWGPRPAELQRWVLGEGRALEKPERYRQVRTWYARDRGRTTVAEVLGLLERAAGA